LEAANPVILGNVLLRRIEKKWDCG